MKTMLLAAALGCLVATPPSQAPEVQPHTQFRVKLTAPVGTATNQKGDRITAQILTPSEFAGGIMEGEVRDSKSGAKLKGKSVLVITFNSIFIANSTVLVSSGVKSFVNSQGKANVDDEGRVVKQQNNIGKVAAVAGLGALIGAIAGGGKGAAIGAGVGGAVGLISVQMAVKAPNITFGAGSEFILDVSPRRE